METYVRSKDINYQLNLNSSIIYGDYYSILWYLTTLLVWYVSYQKEEKTGSFSF